MNVGEYFKFEILGLLKKTSYNCNFSLTISSHQNQDRCIARIWDNVNWDINKQCCRQAVKNNLCQLHNKNCASGYVNEYPDEKVVLRAYRKHNINVDNQINLGTNKESKILFSTKNIKFNINLKTKKNIVNNLKMSFESIDDLNDIICSLNTDNFDKLKTHVLSTLRSRYNFYATIAEDRIISKQIRDHIFEKTSKNNVKDAIETKCVETIDNEIYKEDSPYSDRESENEEIDIDGLEHIKIIDNEYNESLLFIKHNKNDSLLYNENNKLIGYYRFWIDDEEEVPDECKTKDNKVLHPTTKLPIIEVEITPHGSIYTGLTSGIYREYMYDESFETFRTTNQVLK